ncbi:hypothetical protein [Kitasatospora sp. MAP5-34]|uniref:hypothetical protein n=1 Tax=Kitasatospora sp. MAP5-34 TaxID=3035102 RepID=UPI0024753050|nr:hypothetical protein [Kitasatospora sp. MAP5-34]MDH6577408.1 hypothetical protein [Kitasatospora sp. MAP5-34]
MSSDRRPFGLHFSEPPVDQPVQTEGHRLPSADQAIFQQPPVSDAELPVQGRGRLTQAVGGPNFSAPERQG